MTVREKDEEAENEAETCRQKLWMRITMRGWLGVCDTNNMQTDGFANYIVGKSLMGDARSI